MQLTKRTFDTMLNLKWHNYHGSKTWEPEANFLPTNYNPASAMHLVQRFWNQVGFDNVPNSMLYKRGRCFELGKPGQKGTKRREETATRNTTATTSKKFAANHKETDGARRSLRLRLQSLPS